MKTILLFLLFSMYEKALSIETWDNFKVKYQRTFQNPAEENLRKSIFEKRINEINTHNQRYQQGLETYLVKINNLTDQTNDEISSTINLPKIEGKNLVKSPTGTIPLPISYNWKQYGYVTPVKNQNNCAASWAFAAAAALESHYLIRWAVNLNLSVQQLIDCVTTAQGCVGGSPNNAFNYLVTRGLNYDVSYPYQGIAGLCKFNEMNPYVTLKGYGGLAAVDEELLKDIVVNMGPVTVAFDISGNFPFYSSGVYFNPACSSTTASHSALIVGYGNENGLDYWLVKNSFGLEWGEDGYVKMIRNRANNCGIATYVSFPIL